MFLGDTAMHLGTAMDELMRHQPTLKTDAMKAIIKVFHSIVNVSSYVGRRKTTLLSINVYGICNMIVFVMLALSDAIIDLVIEDCVASTGY